jgi:hypothetical protein
MDILLLIIGTASFSSAATEVMSAFCVFPVRPDGEFAGEGLGSHDAVARGVLDVEVQVVALHGDDNVEVELQVVRHTLFYAEGMMGLANIPATHLGHCQQERGQGEEERPNSSILCLCLVRGFGFGCCMSRSARMLYLSRRGCCLGGRGGHVRKASKAFTTDVAFDSPKAPSSSPWSEKPFIVLLEFGLTCERVKQFGRPPVPVVPEPCSTPQFQSSPQPDHLEP